MKVNFFTITPHMSNGSSNPPSIEVYGAPTQTEEFFPDQLKKGLSIGSVDGSPEDKRLFAVLAPDTGSFVQFGHVTRI